MDDGEASITYRTKTEHLTLGELRRALAAIPARYDDVRISTEGCDCDGPCSGYELDVTGLLFTRKH